MFFFGKFHPMDGMLEGAAEEVGGPNPLQGTLIGFAVVATFRQAGTIAVGATWSVIFLEHGAAGVAKPKAAGVCDRRFATSAMLWKKGLAYVFMQGQESSSVFKLRNQTLERMVCPVEFNF